MTVVLADELRLSSNNPPLAELLVEETADLARRAAELSGWWAVSTDYTLERLSDLNKLMGALIQSTETRRKERKKPFLDDGRAVDAAFGVIRSDMTEKRAAIALRLAEAMEPSQQVRGDYSVCTGMLGHVVETVDRAMIDLEALRPFLALDAIEEAIAKFIEAHPDGWVLRGANIIQKTFVRVT